MFIYYFTPWLEYRPLVSALKTMDKKCIHVVGIGCRYEYNQVTGVQTLKLMKRYTYIRIDIQKYL